MIRNIFYILCLLYLSAFSQDEKLRTEIIDVFKEYAPEISNSSKISKQPVFNDTLKNNIMINKSILNQNLVVKEDIVIVLPDKFRFEKLQSDFKKYFSFDCGSKGFLNTKMHYTNGISTLHNSGLYVEYDTEAYLIKKDYDGSSSLDLNLYTNRFLNKKLLKTTFGINNKTGFYWARNTMFPIDSVEIYDVSTMSFNIDLHQPSNNNILSHCSFNIDYLFNNYKRSELFINSSISLETEKALKIYAVQLDLNLINTTFSSLSNNAEFNSAYNRVASIQSMNGFSDILLKSNFSLSGVNILDYEIGIDFQYFPGEEIKYGGSPLIFPNIALLKRISHDQQITFNLYKALVYHSFNALFNRLPYLDPYYRNMLSKEFKVNLKYNQRLSNDMSFSTDLDYIIERGSLIPFIFSERPETIDDGVSLLAMNPLGIYRDRIQQGFLFSSSISLNREKFNFLLEGNLSFIKSRQHDNKQFVPQFEMNSIFTLQILQNINLISNWYFRGSQDAIRIEQVYDPNTLVTYTALPSYLNTDCSLNYNFNSMVFSLDFKNIFGQNQYFFDEYYDDDGFKISVGFLYKF